MDGRKWTAECCRLSGQNLAVSIGPEWSWGMRGSYQEDAVSQIGIVTRLEHVLFRKHQKMNIMLNTPESSPELVSWVPPIFVILKHFLILKGHLFFIKKKFKKYF